MDYTIVSLDSSFGQDANYTLGISSWSSSNCALGTDIYMIVHTDHKAFRSVFDLVLHYHPYLFDLLGFVLVVLILPAWHYVVPSDLNTIVPNVFVHLSKLAIEILFSQFQYPLGIFWAASYLLSSARSSSSSCWTSSRAV